MEGMGSKLVHSLLFGFGLLTLGLSVGTRCQKSAGRGMRCSMQPASGEIQGIEIGSVLSLLVGQCVMMLAIRCMCCGKPLAPGGNRRGFFWCFAFSWLTFIIAEPCIYIMATSGEKPDINVFIAAVIFVGLNIVLNMCCYMYFTQATLQAARNASIKAGGNVEISASA